MDNRPLWVPKVEAALARGDEAYREAAATIDEAMRADGTLTGARVAEFLGHKRAWVSRLLKWFHEGCPPGGPFSAEIAARRKLAADVSTSKHGVDIGPDRPWLPGIEGGPLDEPQQTGADLSGPDRIALAALEACRSFNKIEAQLTCSGVRRVLDRTPGNRRLIEKLAAELRRSTALGEKASREVRAALGERPRTLEAAE